MMTDMPSKVVATNGPPEDIAAINGIIDQLSRAFFDRDADQLMSHFIRDPDDRFVVFDFSPPLMDIGWRNAYEKSLAFFAQLNGPADISWEERRITVEGHMAFVAARLECRATTCSGDAISLTGRSTIIFQKISGVWLIVHEHDSCL